MPYKCSVNIVLRCTYSTQEFKENSLEKKWIDRASRVCVCGRTWVNNIYYIYLLLLTLKRVYKIRRMTILHWCMANVIRKHDARYLCDVVKRYFLIN